MSVFKDVEDVYSLITELVKLRNIVKCPICLEIVNKPLQISCGHIYCTNCINTFINETPSKLNCPLCRKHIKRQRRKPHENVEPLVNFVTAVSRKLKQQFGCDISVLADSENVVNILKKNTKNNNVTPRSRTSKRLFEPPQELQLKSSRNEKQDAFDVLRGPSLHKLAFTKNKNVKTYGQRRNKKAEKQERYQALINFEDESTKLKIIEWLCDSRNKFERLTQTQCVTKGEDDPISAAFDMPSISQNIVPTSCKPDLNTKGIKRARSLEANVKHLHFKVRPRSVSSSQLSNEEITNIEEVDSDKDIFGNEEMNILHLLEEKCLNTIESELAIQSKDILNNTKHKNKLKHKQKTGTGDNAPKTPSPGWIRVGNLEKTFEKVPQKLKKLPISVSSSSKLNKRTPVKKLEGKDVCGEVKPPIVVNKLSSECELHNVANALKPKHYNLHDVESYIANHISREQSISKKVVELPENLVTVVEINNEKSNKLDKDIVRKESSSTDSIFSQKQIEEVDLFEEGKNASQPLTDDVEKKFIALFSPSPERCSNSSSIFTNPSSIISEVKRLLNQLDYHTNSLNSSQNGDVLNDIKLCIRKMKSKLVPLQNSYERGHNFPQDQPNPYLFFTTQTVLPDTKLIAIQTEKCDTSGFKISSTAEFLTLTRCDAEVQTEYTGAGEMSNNQNEQVHNCTVAVQTEDRMKESLTCDTKIINQLPSRVLNEDENCITHNYQFTQSMDNLNFDTQVVINQSNKIKTHDIKPQAEDIPFDYQQESQVRNKLCANEIAEGFKCIDVEDNMDRVIQPGSPPSIAIISEKNCEDFDKKSTQHSTLAFSMSPEKYGGIAYNIDAIRRFKRARALLEDGDSDDGFVKKIKRKENPYLAPHLSIEFVSQEDENVDKREIEKQDEPIQIFQTQPQDYNEYVNKMNSYESNVNTSTPMKFLVPQPKRTKSQCIIDKCNALIKEADDSTTVSPPRKRNCKEDVMSEAIIKEFNLPFDETLEDHENLEPEDNKNKAEGIKNAENYSQSLFCNNQTNTGLTQYTPLSNIEILAKEFETELDPIQNKSETSPEVVILDDILIQKEDDDDMTELQYNLEDELEKMEAIERASDKSEEIFSDYDADVVETTPQKIKPINISSLSRSKRNNSRVNSSLPGLPLPESPDVVFATETVEYLNQTFDPPTEFQDPLDENSLDLTLVPMALEKAQEINANDSVVEKATPQLNDSEKENVTIKPIMDNDNIKKSALVERNLTNIQDNSVTFKNTSFTNQKVRDVNPIERALKSNFDPLEIIPRKSQNRRLPVTINIPKTQKSILTYISSQAKPSQKCASSYKQLEQIKPCISCTRLTNDQLIAISALTNRKLATYSPSFNKSVTHMVVFLNENNYLRDHTVKFISAVAAGIWVVGFDWVQECLRQNRIVSEEPFEALDMSGFPGPKTSRLSKCESRLLRDFKVYVAPPFGSVKRDDIENVVMMLEGEVLHRLEDLHEKSGIRLIITQASGTQDFAIYETWLETFKVITVDIEWLCKSVSQYQLLSVRPFALCSDDNINELGYPEHLLIDSPFFSEISYDS